jgi:hypothetical protein
MDNETRLSIADTIESLVVTTKRVDDLTASLLAIRLTLAELGPDFERLYAKHFAGPDVQQAIRLYAAQRDLLLASASVLRRSL